MSLRVAWISGLFEGEGWTGTYVTRFPYLAIEANIKMTDAGVVKRIPKLIGMGYVNGPYSNKKKPKHNPTWTWRIKGSACCNFLQIIYPFLGTRRQKQIQKAISKWNKRKLKTKKSSFKLRRERTPL